MAGFSLGQAILETGIDLAGLKKGLAEAEGASEGAIGRIGGVFKAGLGLAAGAVVAGIGLAVTAIVGLGTAAFAAGQELDAAFDSIVIKTGATGKELDGLKESFRTVFASVPTDAGTASTVIGELNARLGLTGDTLEEVAAPLLEMTRLVGGDASTNTALLARLVGDWGIANEDVAGTLDKVFLASQETGAGVDSLMTQVVQFGAPLRLMGFTLDDSIALFAKWEKEGVNAELVMGSLRIAAGKFADSGMPLRDSLLATFDSIKNNTDASAALAEGMDVFGARAGPDMVAAIREGRFSIEELVTAMGSADGAIMNTAAQTADFGEKFTLLKNQATLALEPLGMMLMDVASKVMDSLVPVMPHITALATAFSGFLAALISGGDPAGALASIGAVIGQIFGPEAQGGVMGMITQLLAFVSTVQTNGPIVLASLQPVVAAAMGLATAFMTSMPMIQASVQGMVDFVVALFNTFSPTIIANVTATLTTISAFWTAHGAEVMAVVSFLFNTLMTVIGGALTLITGIISTAITFVTGIWTFWSALLQGDTATAWATIQATIATALQTILATLTTILAAALSITDTSLAAFIASWTGTFALALAIVQTFFSNLITSWTGTFTLALTIVQTFFSNLTTAWTGTFTLALTIIQTFFSNLITAWTGNFSLALSIVQGFIASVISAVGAFGTTIIGGFQWIVRQIVGAFNIDWGAIGSGIIGGITQGVMNAAGGLGQAAADAANWALQQAKNALGIGSPSKEGMALGENLFASFGMGAQRGAAQAESSVVGASLGLLDMLPGVRMAAQAASPAVSSSQNFDIDARGSVMSAAQIEAVVRRVLSESGRTADARLRMGTA